MVLSLRRYKLAVLARMYRGRGPALSVASCETCGHRISMDTQMPVSVHASQQKPTKLSLRPGQVINVDTSIRAIVIRSARISSI